MTETVFECSRCYSKNIKTLVKVRDNEMKYDTQVCIKCFKELLAQPEPAVTNK